jgi:hypothetical protein
MKDKLIGGSVLIFPQKILLVIYIYIFVFDCLDDLY